MAQSHLDSVKSMYDERSEQYDENQVHVKQAQDYIQWASPKRGESLLDLACGTGLVALSAKTEVGNSGHVVGVDISEGMLNVARRKAKAADLDIPFFNHEITDLSSIVDQVLPQNSKGFDIITCASALILLPDPLKAVKHWKSLLQPGGRLVTDVQTKDANLVMNIFSFIAPKVGVSVPWHSHLWQSQQALEKLMVDAGLHVDNIFETDVYMTTLYSVNDAELVFNRAVSKAMFKDFDQPDIREEAKRLFVQRFVDIAGGPVDGVDIAEETRYWVVVATNPA